MNFEQLVTAAAQRWIDRRARSPRGWGFGVDEGLPDRGRRYGGAQTIHNTGTVDIVMEDGKVVECWFRCAELPFRVSDPKGHPVYGGQGQGPIVAVEFAAPTGEPTDAN